MIRFNVPEHGRIIAAAADFIYNPYTDPVISREERGELWGGVTFQGYTGAAVYMHVAGFRPRWGNRDLLWCAFHYPFIQLGCKRVFGEIRSSNPKMLEFVQKIGFNVVARVPDVFPDGDMLIVAMSRDTCHWLNLRPREVQCGSQSKAAARPGL